MVMRVRQPVNIELPNRCVPQRLDFMMNRTIDGPVWLSRRDIVHRGTLCRSARLLLIAVILVAISSRCPAAGPELTVTDWDGVQQRVRAARGKVVVVQIWTMTCPTCRDEFPQIVRQVQQFPADRIEWIAVNCDYDGIADKPPEWYQPAIRTFLNQHRGRLVHLQLDVPFLDFLDQQQLGATPAYYVYGADGQLARRFPTGEDEEFSLDEVLRFVDLRMGSGRQ